MKVKFINSVDIAQNIKSFNFKPPAPVKYTAGQYIQLTIPHPNPDARGEKHWFTLSSSPTEDVLTITTKFSDPSSTFKKTLASLAPGTELDMDEPEGDFTLPANKETPLLFVAGGIGVTPFRSMIKSLLDGNEKRTICLMYGLRSENELAFKDLFTKYDLKLVPMVGLPLTAEGIMERANETPDTLVYVSGPEPMVEKLNGELLSAGLPQNKLKTDYFPNYDNTYSWAKELG